MKMENIVVSLYKKKWSYTSRNNKNYHEKTISLNIVVVLFAICCFFPGNAFSFGSPSYIPDGPHPRIWLTNSVVAQMKAKKVAAAPEWTALQNRLDVFFIAYDASHTTAFNSNYSLYSWPGGDGYVGSGFFEAIMSAGLAYHTLKGPAYGTVNATTDDIKAAQYATWAFSLMDRLITKYSAGEEKDGIEFIRLSDNKSSQMVTFNASEALVPHANGFVYTTNGNLAYKSGYAARALAMTVPIFFDWFYNDPLMTTELKTTLYKMMYRHIDWYNAVRSPYNNGILINGVRYHEDNFGKDANGNIIPGACTGVNNCNVAKAESYKAYGYGNPGGVGRIGSNFFEPYVGLVMMNAVAAYGDAPQTDADHYLNYAKTLWTQHKAALSSPTGFKGGDSLEGLGYNSDWHELLYGVLALHTGAGIDTWTGFDFPKDFVRNYIHNTDPTLTYQMYRSSVHTPQNSAYWLHPVADTLNTFSHVLRNYYPSSDEAKQLQHFLNTAKLSPRSHYWENFLFRNNSAQTKDFSSEPLSYRSEGSGVVTTRSTWSPLATAAVSAQVVLGGVFNVDHQAHNQGALLINRGQDRLLSRLMATNKLGDETSYGQNSIVFADGGADGYGIIDKQSRDNGMTSGTPTSATPTAPLIDRFVEAGPFMYVSADVSHIFKGTNNYKLASLFRRSVLHLRPGVFVVYDVTRSDPVNSRALTNKNKKAWMMHFEAAPTIDQGGRNLSATVGSSKIYIKGLYPAGGTYTTTNQTASVNPSFASAFYRVKYNPAVEQEYDQFLHVIEATGKNQETMTKTVRIDASTGNMRGAYIFDPTNPDNNWVAMFTADQTGALVNETVQYELPTDEEFARKAHYPRHIIVDLLPSSDYTFISPKSKNDEQIYTLKPGSFPAEGSIFRSTSQGVVFVDKVGPARPLNQKGAR